MDPGNVREPLTADEKQRFEKSPESPWGYERVSEAIEIFVIDEARKTPTEN
jgi:hypothetical protein